MATAGLRTKLAAECVGNLKEAIVDAWILSCSAMVRDVVIAVFGANRFCFGAVQFESGPKVKSEVERAGQLKRESVAWNTCSRRDR